MMRRSAKLFAIALMTMTLTALISTPLTADNGATSLSVQPSTIIVPLTDLEQGATLVAAEIHLNNVQDLKDFELTVAFDGQLLEFFDILSGEMWNLSGSGGYNPGLSSLIIHRTLRDVASGSGHLYTLWFRPISIGSADIKIVASDLVNSDGGYIPHTIVGNAAEVQIVTLATWVDGEYEKLSTQYDELQAQYTDLEAKHIDLEADYLSLEVEHQSTFEQLEATKSQLSTTQILLYVFIGATAVLLFLMIFLLLRRRGATP